AVIAFIDEEHVVVEMANLLQPLAEGEQTGAPGGLGKQEGNTGGPVFEFLVAHGGLPEVGLRFNHYRRSAFPTEMQEVRQHPASPAARSGTGVPVRRPAPIRVPLPHQASPITTMR